MRSAIGRAARSRLALAAGATAAALAATSAPAVAAEAEQVNRADGVAGAFPIEASVTGAPLVTADGATAYFVLASAEGGWAKATGLYRRDIVTNTTTQIAAGGDIAVTSLSDDGRYVGFTTAKGLVSSDGNKTRDLYGYDATTKKFNLVSRADGVNGAPLGLTSGAYITRDGKSALLGTKSGIARRDLATGRTTKIGDGQLAGWPSAVEDHSDRSASADGKVYAIENGIVTPRGVEVLTGRQASPFPFVSPSGRWVLTTRYEETSTGTKPATTLLDTSTGTRTPYDLAARFGQSATVEGFTASDAALVARQSSTGLEILEVSLTGAPAKTLATYPKSARAPMLNATGKFLSTGGAGAAWLIAADGVSIPGGADLPSPGTRFSVFTGCRATYFPLNVPARPTSITAYSKSDPAFPLPALSGLTVKITNRSGKVLANGTLENVDPITADLPPSGHPYAVSATTKYADGRSVSETWSLAAPSQTCFLGL